MRVLFALIPLILSASALDLTPTNWNEKTAGKTVFLKMFAPWCGHCKAMKPAWDAVSKEFQNSDIVLMADVDCVGSGKELCDRNGVKGFPTIKFGDPNSLEDYTGARDEDSLRKFASGLKPSCDVKTLEHCSEEQEKVVKTFNALGIDDLQNMINSAEAGIMGFEAQFEKNVQQLQKKYESFVKTKDDGIADIEKTSNLNLLKAVFHNNKQAEKSDL